MIAGILCGLAAAFLQSSSYVCSKIFILKYQSPLKLVAFSQLVMGLLALAFFGIAFVHVSYPWENPMLWRNLACAVLFGISGQFFFFRTIREIEASRLSSLLGLKIIVLTFLCVAFMHQHAGLLQILAVLLCAVSAVGMNFAGARISWRGALLLLITLASYALSDIFSTELVLMVSGDSFIWKSMGAVSLDYIAIGIIGTSLMSRTGWNARTFLDAVPYGICWFSAMIMLFVCFGTIGVVFGNIVQATRGILSVLIGVVLLKLGCRELEPAVSRNAWIRRALMALLMLLAIALYSYSPQT